jgi:hypothetical protein
MLDFLHSNPTDVLSTCIVLFFIAACGLVVGRDTDEQHPRAALNRYLDIVARLLMYFQAFGVVCLGVSVVAMGVSGWSPWELLLEASMGPVEIVLLWRLLADVVACLRPHTPSP